MYPKSQQTIILPKEGGENGLDKQIDVLATGIFHSMSTEELLDLDLAYAPTYNGVWDPNSAGG